MGEGAVSVVLPLGPHLENSPWPVTVNENALLHLPNATTFRVSLVGSGPRSPLPHLTSTGGRENDPKQVTPS